jgi:hypothetical protein
MRIESLEKKINNVIATSAQNSDDEFIKVSSFKLKILIMLYLFKILNYTSLGNHKKRSKGGI